MTDNDRPEDKDAEANRPNADDQDQGKGGNARGNGAVDKRKRRRILLTIGAVFVIAGVVWFLLWYFIYSVQASTDDAYVHGNQVMVSSQVAGTVTSIDADNTDLVQAGQAIVRLDPVDARVKLAKARNGLAEAVRRFRRMQADAAQADAAVEAQKVELSVAESDLRRRQPLASSQAVAGEELSHLRDRVRTLRAQLKLARQKANAAHVMISGTDVRSNPSVLQAEAEFRKAWLAVHRTDVRAPVTGYVANRSVQVGSSIDPGQPLMQIIPLDRLWIDANFKEGQIEHIRIGQPVSIKTDVYGDDVTFHGKVVGLEPGTGSAFALLPPQNASGNWIKVVQRVPVRISLRPGELHKHPLRVGLSATVTVDTSHRSGQVLAQAPTNQPVARTSVYATGLKQADHEADAIIRANMAKPAPAAH